jgi:hypothetical protein
MGGPFAHAKLNFKCYPLQLKRHCTLFLKNSGTRHQKLTISTEKKTAFSLEHLAEQPALSIIHNNLEILSL